MANRLAASAVNGFSVRTMSRSTVGAIISAVGKSAIAGLLAVVLFIAALAAAAPVVHRWMHADHASPAHYCLVSLIEQGHGACVAVASVPVEPAPFVSAPPPQRSFIALPIHCSLLSGRGPPRRA